MSTGGEITPEHQRGLQVWTMYNVYWCPRRQTLGQQNAPTRRPPRRGRLRDNKLAGNRTNGSSNLLEYGLINRAADEKTR